MKRFFVDLIKLVTSKNLEHTAYDYDRVSEVITPVRILVSVYPVFLGLFATIFIPRITKSSLAFIYRYIPDVWNGASNNLKIDWFVCVFWFTALFLSVIIFIYLKLDEKMEQARTHKLKLALAHVPNIQTIDEYPLLINEANSLRYSIKKKDSIESLSDRDLSIEMNRISKSIKDTLEYLISFTQGYFKTEKCVYGANIMFHVTERNLVNYLVQNSLLVWREDEPVNGGKYTSIYSIEPNLVIHTSSRNKNVNDKKRVIKNISLLVPQDISSSEELKNIYKGGNFYVRNTSKLKNYYYDFDKNGEPFKKLYFEELGKKIKSYCSYRIGNAKKPIGILNIDSNRRNIIGTDETFEIAFNSLINSFLLMIEEPLDYYGLLYKVFLTRKFERNH